MRVRIAAIAAVAAVGIMGAATATGSASKTLRGTVGPGFTISLKTSTGKKVTILAHGSYRFVIMDKSSIHNFSLKQMSGGSFHRQLTSTNFTGKKTVTVKLTKGQWQFYCSVHPTIMFGNFTVK
jgi:hypothetical protein